MQLPFAVLDVFTTTPFAGNQLGLVRVPHRTPLSKAQEQAIAREFNFSETVFLHDAPAEDAERQVSIWTPFAELPFAGHPTIGTLCYIAQEERGSISQTLRLRILAGPISASYDGPSRRAEAQVPHDFHVHSNTVPMTSVLATQPKLRDIMSASEPSPAIAGACPLVSIVKGMSFILIELPTVESHLAAAQVSPLAVAGVPDSGWESKVLAPFFYVVKSYEPRSHGDATLTRLRARMIESEIGEDPATGSACCTLCVYLAVQRGGPRTTHVFEVEQGVEMGRASAIGVKVELDENGTGVETVLLSGNAVVTMRGSLEI